MSGHKNTSAPVSTRPRAWDFMETVFVALIAYATYHLALWIVILVLWSMPDGLKWSLDQLGLESVADIVATPLVAAVLWIATQMARRDFAEYLALNWPSLEELMRALAITAVVCAANCQRAQFLRPALVWAKRSNQHRMDGICAPFGSLYRPIVISVI